MPHLESPARSAQPAAPAAAWSGLLLGVAMMTLALVAGLNFTFAAAVMPNLSGVDDATFVEITQRFNANPVFPVVFTLAFVALAAAVAAQSGRRGPARWWSAVALGLLTVVLGITGAFHLPLNAAIDRVDRRQVADLAVARADFETMWVAGNVVRTLLCGAAVAALSGALLAHGRSAPAAGLPSRAD